MANNLTLDDLIRIFGEDCIPSDVNKTIFMKHFTIGENRIIGNKTIDKIKQVLTNSIEAARAEQNKDRGGVAESPLALLQKKTKTKPKASSKTPTEIAKSQASKKEQPVEDRYGIKTIRSGIVSKRLQAREQKGVRSTNEDSAVVDKKTLPQVDGTKLPSVEDLTVLSGGKLSRNGEASKVQREIAIRDYQVKDEGRSVRWGKETIKNREGKEQEITNPAYIFHSDLWQLENARTPFKENRCDILQHVSLDMVANNINVVMLEGESEPFFVVEGFGVLESKDSLKAKIHFRKLIQLLVISCDAWQIALKKPEAMLKGRTAYEKDSFHAIDMTSVVPLETIRNKTIQHDNRFKANYDHPETIVTRFARDIQKHRKNIIWTCGNNIDILRKVIKEHKQLIDTPVNALNMVIVGTEKAIHPLTIKYQVGLGSVSVEEMLPGYCSKHSTLSENVVRSIFGSIPVILEREEEICDEQDELARVAKAVYQRLCYSAAEIIFDPGYISGNPFDMLPVSKMDIILPPDQHKLEKMLDRKGLFVLD